MSPWIGPALIGVSVVVLTAVMLRLLFDDERRVRRRLRSIARDREGNRPGNKQTRRPDYLPQVASLLARAGRYGAVERRLRRAGLEWRPGEFAAACLALVAGLAGLGWLIGHALGAVLGIAVGAVLPAVTLSAATARRLRRFEQQLPDALMLIASSLRSGYGILRAMQAVADEMSSPISAEFSEVLDETKLGVSVEDGLRRLVERVPLPDLEIAVTAMLIQLEVGGNLAELMETVAATVRERQRLRAEMDTLTAEARLSGVVLFALPLAMAVILAMLNPAYMAAILRTSLGHFLIACAAALQLAGGLVIRRMLRLEF